MKLKKVNTYNLEKCYAIAPLKYNDNDYILVAAEKQNKCLLFDLEGNLVDTIWEGPGGTMSMVQVPNSNGQFIATQKFYSPNDSSEAVLVLVTPVSKGNWQVTKIADLPYVHRFDIITENNTSYIIACTLKSDHKYKDDWEHPGQILVSVLPDEIDTLGEDNLLKFNSIKDGLTKNHGYCRVVDGGKTYAMIASQNGVYEVSLSGKGTNDWIINKVLSEPLSDIALADFDGDGVNELITISPFHGELIRIFKKVNGCYKAVYEYPLKAEFAHSIWAGQLDGKNKAIIGHRQGSRNIIGFEYIDGEYKYYELDSDVGSANVFKYKRGAIECLVSTNREIDEIAFYEFV